MIMLTQNEAKRVFELIWQESNLDDLETYDWNILWKLARESNQPAGRIMLIQQEANKIAAL